MDFSKLIERVNIVLKAVSAKSTMPILGCLILEVSNNIKLITTLQNVFKATNSNGEDEPLQLTTTLPIRLKVLYK